MRSGLPRTVELRLGLDEPEDARALRRRCARQLGVPEAELPPLRLLRRSLDARRGRVRVHMTLALDVEPAPAPSGPPLREVRGGERVAIVGSGPAGLFCAYQLARYGVGSVIVERGKQVRPRRRDLQRLNRGEGVDSDSNYCFGEGGAGTYSDGKLYTRSHKRGSVRDVLEILVSHGAPAAILTEARPHIGSNRLPAVVEQLRGSLQRVGVGFRFQARVEDLLCEGDRAVGVRLHDGAELAAQATVLATGHSARDVLQMLARRSVALLQKGFAVGVRIEHPQPWLNQMQYGAQAGHPKLPAAAYRVAAQIDGRGVFSFCMCPGGFIVPATTEAGFVVVNGMSPSRRNSPFANAGLVVAVEPEDLRAAGLEGVDAGLRLQAELERAAWQAGGGRLRAPAARASDFLAGRISQALPACSYKPGLATADLDAVLGCGGLALSRRLRAALSQLERRMPGYAGQDAVLVGVESRTSSPVRVERDPESLQSPTLRGLYPCGEGAGYAGGIVSAALDGMRVADAIARQLATGG